MSDMTHPQQHDTPVWQIIVGLLVPVVGVVLAIVLFAQGRGNHGAAVLLASVLGGLVTLALLG